MPEVDNITKTYKPIVLIILDGWGLSPAWGGNAISVGNPMNFNSYWRDYPHRVLQALGKIVDNKSGKVSSSEVGHASIGTGRLVLEDLTEINKSIRDGSFYQNVVLTTLMDDIKEKNTNLHLIGLLSDGGVHSHTDHIFALLLLAKKHNLNQVYIHAITDGLDTDPHSALGYLYELERKIKEIGIGVIATVCGRAYAMDRNNNWDKTAKTYEAQAMGHGYEVFSARSAISEAYKLGYSDSLIPPSVIIENKKPIVTIQNNDGIIFFNFRADRMKQLARAYADKNCFKSLFTRRYRLMPLEIASFTSYHLEKLPIKIIFPASVISSSLAQILSAHGLRQMHIAETEKYAHVTYFFNGGTEVPFPKEDRIFISSIKVRSYEEKPAMALDNLTDEIMRQINSNKYDFIVANIPNVDMVAHTGNILATQRATSLVDNSLKKIYNEIIKRDAALIITADHGNAEQMSLLGRKFGERHHTLNPVPFILITPDNKKNLMSSALGKNQSILPEMISSSYTLADVAPTILDMLGISKPVEMTGKSLLDTFK
ncbi:MAG: 2,3-bisphosphoglycerate-independent phosphoglycerate mutase [Patescibacteria group bacterium]|nr:2,3-bisphosphoglycerate-independent phosphoglycerate mutase [Patescibacteria group bacterium]